MEHRKVQRQHQVKNHKVRKTSKFIPSASAGATTFVNSFTGEGGESVTPKTLANPPTPMSLPKPHFTSTPESSPCKAGDDALIEYVHSLSPLKRN